MRMHARRAFLISIPAVWALAIVLNSTAARASEQLMLSGQPENSPNNVSALSDSAGSQSIDLSTAAGIKWEFRPQGGYWQPIRVPEGGWKPQGFKTNSGTYRTWIHVPESATGHVLQLAFAAVNFGAVVLAGSDEEHLQKVAEHLNGWMPFTADLTAIAKPGTELLVEVQVKGREAYRLANGKYAIAEGASWFSELADGLLRGIQLQILSLVSIKDVHVITTRNPDLLNVTATVVNAGDAPKTITLSGQLSSWNKDFARYPRVVPVTATIPAHTTSSVSFSPIAWSLGPKSYWWPNVPYRRGYETQLHNISLQVSVDSKVLSGMQQRFGFREFRVIGNHYELNGIHTNLRGDNQQEANFGTDAYGVKRGFGPPTTGNGGWPEAVDNLLQLNFNVLRIHQIPATPYMLDVADEKGLMLVGESPLRGSEQLEDWAAGRTSMLEFDREMVLRDRNHPAIVLWSAANEWDKPMSEAVPVIRQVDGTRPIIADGVNEDMGAGIINMQHYVSGIGKLPLTGGTARSDRPYGETEAVWDADNTLQGFAWMATSVRLRRAKGDADLRNYVLNNVWSNYVPGESAETEILERKVKKMGDSANWAIQSALSDPWNNPHIKLMQQCYAPVAIADLDFDRVNAESNKDGDWPLVKPKLSAGQPAVRSLTVFNDDLAGEHLDVKWEVSTAKGVLKKGDARVSVPLGEQRVVQVKFSTPLAAGDLVLKVQVWKVGVKRFSEDRMVFEIVQ